MIIESNKNDLTMETEKIAREVNYIIIHNLDAEDAYKEAAANVENDKLRNALLEEADKRLAYAHELQRELEEIEIGEKIADSISMGAIFNRIWVEIKGLFTTQNDDAIIDECRKGDDVTMIAYDTILNIGDGFLPPRIYNIISKQRQEIALTYQALIRFHELKTTP